MQKIEIHELQEQADLYVNLVRQGLTVQIEDGGRPVALLVPIPQDSVVHRLEEEGGLSPARNDLLELGPPLPPHEDEILPSEVLGKMCGGEKLNY